MIVLIAAIGNNGVIGAGGRIPWSLPEDLRRFRRLTMGNAIIMGRTTHKSIGRPLDGRTNIVLSRNPAFHPPGVVVARTVEEAVALAEQADGDDDFVIGGADIYRQFLPRADRLELTLVDAAPPGDTHFPDWERAAWREVSSQEVSGSLDFAFRTYERQRPVADHAADGGYPASGIESRSDPSTTSQDALATNE